MQKTVTVNFNPIDIIKAIRDLHYKGMQSALDDGPEVDVEEWEKHRSAYNKAEKNVNATLGSLFWKYPSCTTEVFLDRGCSMVGYHQNKDGTKALTFGIVYNPESGTFTFHS
jgi:hypothetical protein